MFTQQSLIGLCTVAMCCLVSLRLDVRAQRDSPSKARIVLLGTGTPSPDPERSGPATAIVVNGTPYLIDFGPGVVRRIAAASLKGVPGLSVLTPRKMAPIDFWRRTNSATDGAAFSLANAFTAGIAPASFGLRVRTRRSRHDVGVAHQRAHHV